MEKDVIEKLEEVYASYLENENIDADTTRDAQEQIKNYLSEYYSNVTPIQKVEIARDKNRFTSLDLINLVFDEFIELSGDRLFSDDKAVVCGLATIGKDKFTVIGQQKGKNIEENIERNFGMLHPEGYRKAIRLAKQAEKFKRPIIYFIDTPGAYCGLEAEERGEGEAIANCLFELPALNVPQIAFVVGEGGSGGALAFSVTDKLYMLENSIYSILSPEGFASILWKDSKKSPEAAKLLQLTSKDMIDNGFIDGIISESYPKIELTESIARDIQEIIKRDILVLSKNKELVNQRYTKIRNITK